MAGAPAAVRAPSTAQLLSIGQVLARLSPEFPDLTPSKLRFLEEQGLISPARTESGYRKFGAADLERIERILTMQRDQYLPLKVIRSHLEQLDAGHVPTLPAATAPSMLGSARRLSREELLSEAGASSALLGEAVSASLLNAGDVFGEDAVTVLRCLVELRRVGIEPRHLRGFRAAAEREAALVETATATLARKRDSASRAKAAELAIEVATHLETVRANLTRAAIVRGTQR
ncbi:MerR family transcriptional regulator [Rathayibacter sp. YIM 133350]|uniref:transcriptional regulator FtsR n=1 Tax=Rathayibacter sp. YIM 133350 TaxID=3131992 RepID=UPI00307CDB07